LKQINLKFNDFEKTIDKAASNSDFVKILHLQKSLIFFETSLRANNLMLVKMKRTNFLNTRQNEDNDDFFEEIIVENHQAIEMTEVYSRILDSSMQTISSIISNNVNMVMKRLTGITMVLIVPSIISGLWGMNVPLPLANNPFGFLILSFSALLVVVFISLFFIRKNWL
jgi:magnesium transporter